VTGTVAALQAPRLNRRSVRVADGSDWEWQERALCRGSGETAKAWTVDPWETVDLGGFSYEGVELIEFAKATCAMCASQWDCIRFAIQIGATAGTWGGVYHEDFRAVRKLGSDVIDKSERIGRPVQLDIATALNPPRRRNA
jgi:hypothetical protein